MKMPPCFAAMIAASSAFCSPLEAAIFSTIDHHATRSAWTFTGSDGDLIAARPPASPLVLLVDDVDGPLPAIPMAVRLEFELSLSHLRTTPAAGGVFAHSYSVDGVFSIHGLDGGALLNGSLATGLMTVMGDAESWRGAALVVAGAPYGAGSAWCEWVEQSVLAYDLDTGEYAGSAFQFRLTNVNAGGLGVPLDPETHLPAGAWQSGVSFTGRNNIPAPATVTFGAVGAAALMRRRRNARVARGR
jgi:uncharacterized protein (TIGR03382 family)